MHQQYTLAKGASSSTVNQNNTLQGELDQLKARLANIRQESEKYDREFLDYSSGGGSSRFTRWGISTLQDWLLLFFFFSYAFICVFLIVFATNAAGFSISTLVSQVVGAIVFGIMMSAVIMRFV